MSLVRVFLFGVCALLGCSADTPAKTTSSPDAGFAASVAGSTGTAGLGSSTPGASGSPGTQNTAGIGIAPPIAPGPPPAAISDEDAGAGPTAAGVLQGSCKRSTVESNLLPANILFVLDRSASMLCNPPPTTGSAACEQMPVRANMRAASKWEITTQALTAAIRALPPNATVGLSYFSNDDQCGVSSTPSVPLVVNTPAQQDAIARSIQSVKPGGGTPIVGATILAYALMHKSALAGQIFGNEFVVLITDGAQSEQCSYAPRCMDAASCTKLLVDEEVPKAAGRGVGIRTFVVGVPGSEPARTVLSQIAKQGGTAPSDCDPQRGNCHFDMTMVPDLGAALSGALAQIAGQAVSCELNVPKPDQGELDLSLVNVVYTPSGGREPVLVKKDDRKPCESSNGWRYIDDNTKIQLCGAVCEGVRSDSGARVDVVLGCPVVVLI